MDRIKIMSEDLSNKIAAGEVVERIANVIKELTENSIDAQSTEISVSLENAGSKEIKVIDNGIGMDKNTLDKITEIFYTTKANGNGLGVVLSKEIVEMHHLFLENLLMYLIID